MKLAVTVFLFTAALGAQIASKGPLVSTSQGVYAIAKTDILRSMDKIPENLWSFQPTPDVRTVAQLFAHVADGQYEFCGPVAEGKAVDKSIEKTALTRTAIMAAVKDGFAYCDAAYAKMTEAGAAETIPFFGRPMSRIGVMDFNTAHTMEHYGNLVTYMRLKGIVPPSSEAQGRK